MIRNLIFDIGNVLTDFRWKEFLEDKGFDETMIRRIAAASVQTPVWAEMDRGIWTEEQLMAAFVEADPGIETELHQAYDDIRGMVTIRDYTIPLLRELRENGYRLFYLSNFSRKAEVECADSLAFLPYMDGGILSYREKLIKPEPEIYQCLLERYGLAAGECVFVDDVPANVEGAKNQGIPAILFQSKEQMLEDLRGLGVKI